MNYFGWKIIEPLLKGLDDDFIVLLAELRTAQTGASSDVPKWEKCVDSVNDHLPNAVGSIYVRNNFRSHAKVEVTLTFF